MEGEYFRSYSAADGYAKDCSDLGPTSILFGYGERLELCISMEELDELYAPGVVEVADR